MDLIKLQRFLQGSLINTLCAYLRKLELPDRPVHTSSWRYTNDSMQHFPEANSTPSRSQKVQHLSNTVTSFFLSPHEGTLAYLKKR